MMNKLLTTGLLSSVLLTGCTEEGELLLTDSGSSANAGIVAYDHFSLTAATTQVNAIDTDGVFTRTEVEFTVRVGDRNNNLLTDTHVVFFATEFGLIEPSCSTTDGSGTCTVTWQIIRRPGTGEAGADGEIDITAYTLGEESFFDTNNNGVFDDNETLADLVDLREPFIDADGDRTFSAGDILIEVADNAYPAGVDGNNNAGDNLFNGAGCTSSTLCSPTTSIYVFDQVTLDITE